MDRKSKFAPSIRFGVSCGRVDWGWGWDGYFVLHGFLHGLDGDCCAKRFEWVSQLHKSAEEELVWQPPRSLGAKSILNATNRRARQIP